MIAAFSAALRTRLDDETLNNAAVTVASGAAVRCVICGAPVAGGRVNVIAFVSGSAGAAVRYADETCAPSQLIDVDVVPDDDDDVADLIDAYAAAAPDDDVESPSWALSSRIGALPSIVLAVDLGHVADLPVRGAVLLQAFRVDGFRGGHSIDVIQAPALATTRISREQQTLTIHTRHGSEHLALAGDGPLRDALHLAAVQHQMLLVVGVSLGLPSLLEAERQLTFSRALAAAVPYVDPDLAARPLWTRRERVARRVAAVTPSGRRARRERRGR